MFYREVTAFRGFNIVDFEAGYRTSFAIIKGDKEPTSNSFNHKINEKEIEGLLHFYKNEAG